MGNRDLVGYCAAPQITKLFANGTIDDVCTLQEAVTFRNRLREIGDDRFIEETIEAGTITAKKLCTAFGIRPPPFLEDAPDVSHA